RCANDLDPLTSEYLVKIVREFLVPVANREFLVPVANQEAKQFGAFGQRPTQVPGLLRHPRRARIRRASGEMNTAAAEFNEEEHVQSLQPDGLDRKEIDREHSPPRAPPELTH